MLFLGLGVEEEMEEVFQGEEGREEGSLSGERLRERLYWVELRLTLGLGDREYVRGVSRRGSKEGGEVVWGGT